MEWIRQFYFPKPILKMLNKEIIPNVDLWLVIHYLSGVGLFYILGPNNNFLVISLLIGYEVFERYLLSKNLIIGESTVNIILDIISGYIGYMTAGSFI